MRDSMATKQVERTGSIGQLLEGSDLIVKLLVSLICFLLQSCILAFIRSILISTQDYSSKRNTIVRLLGVGAFFKLANTWAKLLGEYLVPIYLHINAVAFNKVSTHS